MLLAKMALGVCGTLVFVTAYTFHEGVLRVDVDEHDASGKHIHVWLPAAIVPIALHVVPRRHLEHAATEAGPWLPTVRAITKELRKFPEAQFVEIHDANQHVRVGTHNGKLLVDVEGPSENVHVACPLAMVEHVSSELEADAPKA